MDFLDNLMRENDLKKYSLKTESQPESLLFKEKVKSAVDPQKKKDFMKKNTLPIKPTKNVPLQNMKHEIILTTNNNNNNNTNNQKTVINSEKNSLNNIANSTNDSNLINSNNNSNILTPIQQRARTPGSPKENSSQKDEKMMSSPYFSKNLHAEEQQKVLRNLKSREKNKEKQYTTRIMKSKKCDIDTLEYVLRTKYTLNHRANMDEYIKKVGLQENTKVFKSSLIFLTIF